MSITKGYQSSLISIKRTIRSKLKIINPLTTNGLKTNMIGNNFPCMLFMKNLKLYLHFFHLISMFNSLRISIITTVLVQMAEYPY